MTKKEKVLGLFEFLMDLLEEKDVKKVENPPMMTTTTPPTKNVDIHSSLELMKKIDEIDKEKANERFKIRMVNNATRPLIKELETLKESGYKNAIAEKEKEETEDSVNVGLTLVDGKPNVVSIPSKLRDNIPLTDFDLARLRAKEAFTNFFPPLSETDSTKEVIDPLKTPVLEKTKTKKPRSRKPINKRVVAKKPSLSKNKRKKK